MFVKHILLPYVDCFAAGSIGQSVLVKLFAVWSADWKVGGLHHIQMYLLWQGGTIYSFKFAMSYFHP